MMSVRTARIIMMSVKLVAIFSLSAAAGMIAAVVIGATR